MRNTTDYRRFNRLLAIMVIGSLLVIAAFNYVTDPYLVWSTPRVRHLNALKPAGDSEARLRVAWEIQRRNPETLIFGTSAAKNLRASTVETVTGIPACNAAVIMCSLPEVRAYLELALREQSDVSHVLLALDFLQFNRLGWVGSKEAAVPRLSVPFTNEGLSLLLSQAGTRASITAISANLRAKDSTPEPTSRAEAFDKYLKTIVMDGNTYLPYELSDPAFRDLQAIVDLCESNRVDLRVMINPIHIVHAKAFRETGLDDDYSRWVRRVTAITPVWDFSGCNSITTEPVGKRMTYYADPLHYTSLTGDLMIRRVYGESGTPSDFGALITSSTVDSHLSRMSKLLDAQLAESASP